MWCTDPSHHLGTAGYDLDDIDDLFFDLFDGIGMTQPSRSDPHFVTAYTFVGDR